MSDAVKEQLSALMDGELPAGELDLLLKRVGRDAELRETVGRYALLGEALRGDAGSTASRDFAARVAAALDGEPAPAASRGFTLSAKAAQRLRTAGGLAIAAGVAAVAVVSVQRPDTGSELVAGAEPAAPAAALVAAQPEPSYVVPAATSASAFVPATRLTNYVVAHSEYSSPLGRRSVLSGVLSQDDYDVDAPAKAPPIVEVSTAHP